MFVERTANMTVNKAVLLGNLTKDPEVRTVQSGDAVANLSLATNETWNDKITGERKGRSEYHKITVWGQTADFVGQYAQKGSKLYVEGQIRTRKWQDKDGNDRYSTEIDVRWPSGSVQLLDPRQENRSREPLQGAQKMPALEDDLDDSLPPF